MLLPRTQRQAISGLPCFLFSASAHAGVTDSSPIRTPGNLPKGGPTQAKPLTGGPTVDPTLGGINRIVASPSPVVSKKTCQ